MKKLIAVLMIVTLLVCMMSVVAFADGVDSPEDNPPTDPNAPQTGVSVNVGLIIALAVVALGTAVVFIRKATV